MIKSKKHFLRLMVILVYTIILFSFPICASAAEEITTVQIPDSVTDTVPDVSEISDNPDYSEGTTGIQKALPAGIRAAGGSVSGGCSITRLSSSSVQISGYSVTSPADPALEITLQLQAYYNGGWHTLATTVKSVYGTRVDLTKTYNVTSGYYYRVYAIHSLADGTSSTSRTSSIWVG